MFLKGFREFINESESSVTYQDLKLLLELGISQDITKEVYHLFDQGKLTNDELLDWVTLICKKYGIKNWSISKEGLVDVDGSVELVDIGITRLPLRFGIVTGSFGCSKNQLTTLEGSPRWVGRMFYCNNNYLTTLKGSPKDIGGDFSCMYNQLTDLNGGPENVGGDLYCNDNQLTTLKGAPKKVRGAFDCTNNQLTSLDGIREVDGRIHSDLKNKRTVGKFISDLLNH